MAIVLLLTVSAIRSQTSYSIVVPDSIKKKCDEAVIRETGKAAFASSVKYIKSDVQKTAAGENYTVFYAFVFPNVKESHVVFSVTCKTEGRKAIVVKDAAFKNYTRLPGDIKAKGVKVIPYPEAKKIALANDSVLKKNQDKLFGEISTDYDDAKKDYFFVWYFYFLEPCKNCASEEYKTRSVYMDAVTGKVLHAAAK
ncbi:MAG: hypothetical protein ACXVPQ_08065 [Bacteroidia bacterium]